MTRSRHEIYERIRQTSRAQFIHEDMVRLGFWRGPHPNDRLGPELRQREELHRQLNNLRAEQSRLHNAAALLKEARKRRMAESRLRQQETRERHERERVARAEAWKLRKAREILYLGRGVSNTLHDHASNTTALVEAGLPLLDSPQSLAHAMGVPVGQLRFLAWQREASRVSHYVRFRLPKKTGGERLISAPMPRLKTAQRWILDHILNPVPVHEAAHGFRAGRSIVSNAAQHVGAEVVVNLDLKDFFPTLTLPRVRGAFKALGYSPAVATTLALLCTEPDTEQIELDGQTWHVAVGPRRLPQGAPTSPAITNIICRRLDSRLSDTAGTLGFNYTRYADDLTFSGSGEALDQIARLIGRVGSTIEDEGFTIHPGKTRILRSSRRQEVTGLIVNEQIAVPRETLRRFRALLFQIDKDGPTGKRWGLARDAEVLDAAVGFANFVYMVDAERGRALKAQVQALVARFGHLRPRRAPVHSPASSSMGAVPGAAPSTPVGSIPVPGRVTPAPTDAPLPAETEIPVDSGAGEGGEGGEGGDKKWWKLW